MLYYVYDHLAQCWMRERPDLFDEYEPLRADQDIVEFDRDTLLRSATFFAEQPPQTLLRPIESQPS